MIVITRKVHGTNEIIVTFKKGSDTKVLGSSSSVSVLDAHSEAEAVVKALQGKVIIDFLKEQEGER